MKLSYLKILKSLKKSMYQNTFVYIITEVNNDTHIKHSPLTYKNKKPSPLLKHTRLIKLEAANICKMHFVFLIRINDTIWLSQIKRTKAVMLHTDLRHLAQVPLQTSKSQLEIKTTKTNNVTQTDKSRSQSYHELCVGTFYQCGIILCCQSTSSIPSLSLVSPHLYSYVFFHPSPLAQNY